MQSARFTGTFDRLPGQFCGLPDRLPGHLAQRWKRTVSGLQWLPFGALGPGSSAVARCFTGVSIQIMRGSRSCRSQGRHQRCSAR